MFMVNSLRERKSVLYCMDTEYMCMNLRREVFCRGLSENRSEMSNIWRIIDRK